MNSAVTSNPPKLKGPELCKAIEIFLDDNKASEMLTLDLRNRSFLADFMVIANGISHRHVGSMAEKLKEHLHQNGIKPVFTEGQNECNWVLVDAGDVIVHLFYPEAREKYKLENMWSVEDQNSD